MATEIKDEMAGCKFTLADNGPSENPLESLYVQMTGDSKDMSIDKRDAWRYGVIVGWSDESYKELVSKHGWHPSAIDRNKRLHAKYLQAWKFIQDAPNPE
jgi:hypothetical protein